jgi:hypothetical protein
MDACARRVCVCACACGISRGGSGVASGPSLLVRQVEVEVGRQAAKFGKNLVSLVRLVRLARRGR